MSAQATVRTDDVTRGALLIIPGPSGTITFVRQERGPYAGSWLLPGGKIEPGESPEDTARREALEETGYVVGSMSGIGLYEMRGQWAQGPCHFMMYVFMANQPALVPDGFAGHHVTAVRQVTPRQARPHPTGMVILNDAGVTDYPQADIDSGMTLEGIAMVKCSVHASQVAKSARGSWR